MRADPSQAQETDGYLRRAGITDRLILITLVGLGVCLACLTLALGTASTFVPRNLNGLHAGWLAAGARPNSQALRDAVEGARTLDVFSKMDISAKRALKVQPLDTLALEAMMISAAKQHNFPYADALAELIVRRDARSSQAQFWLFGRDAAGADYAGSLAHADVLLRSSPEMSPRIFAWMSAMASDARDVKPLTTLLANNPPWRGWFLEFLSSEAKVGPSTVDAVFQLLQDTNRPPTMAEISPHLTKLVDDQQYAEAYVLWLQALPPQALKRVTTLYDPGFEGLQGAAPFNWTLSKTNGGYGEFAPSQTSSGQALHVGYGGNISVSLARQVVLLGPGRYNLNGQYAPDGENSPGQFRIAITCMPPQGGAHLLDAHQVLAGPFALTFQVPESRCGAQVFEILGDPTPDPKPASAWFSKLQLSQALDTER